MEALESKCILQTGHFLLRNTRKLLDLSTPWTLLLGGSPINSGIDFVNFYPQVCSAERMLWLPIACLIMIVIQSIMALLDNITALSYKTLHDHLKVHLYFEAMQGWSSYMIWITTIFPLKMLNFLLAISDRITGVTQPSVCGILGRVTFKHNQALRHHIIKYLGFDGLALSLRQLHC